MHRTWITRALIANGRGLGGDPRAFPACRRHTADVLQNNTTFLAHHLATY